MSVMLKCKNEKCQASFLAPPALTEAVLMNRAPSVGPTLAQCPSCQHSAMYGSDDLTSE
jgi:hypothetical protein